MKTYLLYCSDNQELASSLAKSLSALKVKVVPDDRRPETRREMTQQMIHDDQVPVVMLVTDNYLRSIDCMDGFAEILKDLEGRLIPVVADGRQPVDDAPGEYKNVPTEFTTINDVMQYRDYWYEKWIQLRKSKSLAPDALQAALDNDINIAQKASTTTGGFLRTLRDLKPLSLEKFMADHFRVLMEKVGGNLVSVSSNGHASEPVVIKSSQPQGFDILPSKIIPESGALIIEEPVPNKEYPPMDLHLNGDDHEDAPDGEDEDFPSFKEGYVENVTREMEKAAMILKELDGEELPAPPKSGPSIVPPPLNILDDDDEDEVAIPAVEHPSVRAKKKFEEYLAVPTMETDKAVGILLEVLALDNQLDEAFRHLAQIETARGNASAARNYWEKLISLKSNDADAQFQLAKLFAGPLAEPQQAATYLRNALYLDEANAAYHFEFAKLLQAQPGKEKKSAKHYQRVTEIEPAHAEAHYQLALLCLNALDLKDLARQHYTIASELQPDLKTPENDDAFGTNIPDVEEAQEDPAQNRPAILALITGATSGIGKATAELFAKNGCNLILTGRRADRLAEFKAHLETTYGVQVNTLCFDVRDREAVSAAVGALADELKAIDVLVNNAGLAKGLSTIDQGDIDHWETMIDTNIKGLLYMSRAVSPLMVERRKGHIINICSTAGKEVYPMGNVYCATKFAVDALNRGMRMDLYKHNIRVTSICPAHTEDTEFAFVRFDDAERAKIYEDFRPLKASDVAETIWFAVSRPEYVNINEIILSGTQQAGPTLIDRSGR